MLSPPARSPRYGCRRRRSARRLSSNPASDSPLVTQLSGSTNPGRLARICRCIVRLMTAIQPLPAHGGVLLDPNRFRRELAIRGITAGTVGWSGGLMPNNRLENPHGQPISVTTLRRIAKACTRHRYCQAWTNWCSVVRPSRASGCPRFGFLPVGGEPELPPRQPITSNGNPKEIQAWHLSSPKRTSADSQEFTFVPRQHPVVAIQPESKFGTSLKVVYEIVDDPEATVWDLSITWTSRAMPSWARVRPAV